MMLEVVPAFGKSKSVMLTPDKIPHMPLILVKLKNPVVTSKIKVGRHVFEVYDKHYIKLNKEYFIPLWSVLFIIGNTNQWVFSEKEYTQFLNSMLSEKHKPTVERVSIQVQEPTLMTFQIAYWGSIFLGFPRKLISHDMNKLWPKLWKKVRSDYEHLMELRSYSIYPLMNLIKLIEHKEFYSKGGVEDEGIDVFNILSALDNHYPPVIELPNYPIPLPYIPPEWVVQSSNKSDLFEHFVNPCDTIELGYKKENDEKAVKFVEMYIRRSAKLHSTFINLKDFGVFSSINKYHTVKKILKKNGSEKVVHTIQVNKYGDPVPLDKYLERAGLSGKKEVNLYGQLIDVLGNGVAVFEVCDSYKFWSDPKCHKKVIAFPVTSINFRHESNGVVPLVNVKGTIVLLRDSFTSWVSYLMLKTWGLELKE